MSVAFEGGYRVRNDKIQELCEGESYYDVNWGWAARTDGGGAYIPFDNYTGEPKPYEGFWEARCFGCPI